MMRKRKLLFVPITMIASALLLAGTGFSLAAFSTNTSVGANIPMKGRQPLLIYLDPGKWDIDNALFYMYVWNPSDGSEHEWIPTTAVTSSGYSVFEYVNYDTQTSMLFARVNPNSFDGTTFDNTTIWNQTGNITSGDRNGKNLFTITDWGTGTWSNKS